MGTLRRQYLFPSADCGIRLKAALLAGARKSGAEERIKIIATSQPEPLLERAFQEGFAVYDARSTGLMSDLSQRLNENLSVNNSDFSKGNNGCCHV